MSKVVKNPLALVVALILATALTAEFLVLRAKGRTSAADLYVDYLENYICPDCRYEFKIDSRKAIVGSFKRRCPKCGKQAYNAYRCANCGGHFLIGDLVPKSWRGAKSAPPANLLRCPHCGKSPG